MRQRTRQEWEALREYAGARLDMNAEDADEFKREGNLELFDVAMKRTGLWLHRAYMAEWGLERARIEEARRMATTTQEVSDGD